MKNELYEYLQTNSGNMSTEEILTGFAAAVIIAIIIFISYRFSHSSSIYSAKFNISLIMLTLVTTLVMSVIGNNVALSLGMVGALSIVRFRTVIKDPRDTAYIFWCISVGICCGIGDYQVAGIGTGVIFLVMLLIGNAQSNDRYLLIVRGNKNSSEAVSNLIKEYFNKKARFRVENSTKDTMELIYEVSQTTLRKSEKGKEKIQTLLHNIEGIENVNLVCQNDEINR